MRRGKVRDIYDLGDTLLLVSTDRISAFDWVLPTGIPDKGRVLTQLSRFWFEHLGRAEPPALVRRRTISICRRASIARRSPAARCSCARPRSCRSSASCAAICPARLGRNISRRARVCGIELPTGPARKATSCPAPIFTPATKAEHGEHDENITFDEMCARVGRDLAEAACRSGASTSTRAAPSTRASRGIIIADTKFEFGLIDDELILIDEVLTPDSSRFWPADDYKPGKGQPSFDKQFVRDWLTAKRLGQKQPAARAAGRSRRQDAGEVHRGVRAADGRDVCVEVGVSVIATGQLAGVNCADCRVRCRCIEHDIIDISRFDRTSWRRSDRAQ